MSRNIRQLTTGTTWKFGDYSNILDEFSNSSFSKTNEKTLLLSFDLFLPAESLSPCLLSPQSHGHSSVISGGGSRRLPGPRFYFQSFPGPRKATVISSGLRSSTSYRFPSGGLFEFTHAPTVYSHERRPRLSLFLQFSSSRECNLWSHVARYSISPRHDGGGGGETKSWHEAAAPPLWNGPSKLLSPSRSWKPGHLRSPSVDRHCVPEISPFDLLPSVAWYRGTRWRYAWRRFRLARASTRGFSVWSSFERSFVWRKIDDWLRTDSFFFLIRAIVCIIIGSWKDGHVIFNVFCMFFLFSRMCFRYPIMVDCYLFSSQQNFYLE